MAPGPTLQIPHVPGPPSMSGASVLSGPPRSVLRGGLTSRTGGRHKARSARPAGRRVGIAASTVGGTPSYLAPPGNPSTQVEGWQMKEATVMDRVTLLFNCYTISDVVFHLGDHELPAHKFVLEAASPVLYQQLLQVQSGRADGLQQLSQRNNRFARMSVERPSMSQDEILRGLNSQLNTRVSTGILSPVTRTMTNIGDISPQTPSPDGTGRGGINHVAVLGKYEDFFEMVRFLYTDQILLSLTNAAALVLMADDFKLPALADRCIAYLKAEVKPETALRILGIVKEFMKKALFALWRDALARDKALHAFQELSLAERQRRMAEVFEGTNASDAASHCSSRIGSRAGSRAGSRPGSVGGSRTTSKDSAAQPSQAGSLAEGGLPDAKQGAPSADSLSEMGVGGKKRDAIADAGSGGKYAQFERNLCTQLVQVSEELSDRCWRMIKERTQVVIDGEDWVEQELSTVQKILCIDTCSVSEAALFRALYRWAEHRCKLQKFPCLPEFLKKVLNQDVLRKIRFPTMTLEELQWEVIPSGLLEYQDIRQLQKRRAYEEVQAAHFDGRSRGHPLSDLFEIRQGRGDQEPADQTVWDEVIIKRGGRWDNREGRGDDRYVAAEGDPIDAILGARLWRSRVDTFVQEQEDLGMAFEAGVTVTGNNDSRPVACGNLMTVAAGREGDPHRTRRQFANRPGEKSPMNLTENMISPLVPRLTRPSTARPATSRPLSARPGTRPPSALTAATGSTRPSSQASTHCPDGGTSRPTSGKVRPESGRFRIDGGKTRPESGKPRPEGGKIRPESSKVERRPSVSSNALPALAKVNFSDAPIEEDAVAPTSPGANGVPRLAMPRDFQRITQGLYLFRKHEILELRILEGDVRVYRHGPLEGDEEVECVKGWIAGNEAEVQAQRVGARSSSFAVEAEEVRDYLQLPEKLYDPGVPIDVFISKP